MITLAPRPPAGIVAGVHAMSHAHRHDEFGNPLPVPDNETFAVWDGGDLTRRLVARTAIAPGVVVSTLCLGAEHLGDVEHAADEPRLYETIIIGGPCDGQLWPPATCTEAQRDHAEAVILARGAGARSATT